MSFSAAYFTQRHLLGMEGFSRPAIMYLLDLAQEAAKNPQGFGQASRLAGRKMVTLFLEAAPEARQAFTEAGRRRGAEVFDAPVPRQSATLTEFAIELMAQRPDIVVLRSSEAGVATILAGKLDCALINAGDGAHEDPVEALTVAATICQVRGDVDGQTVAICGDVLHSGAARSLLILLTCLGARVRLVGPANLTPPAIARLGVEVFSDMRAGLAGAAIVIVLPLDFSSSDGAFVASKRDYFHLYGLDEEKLAFARPDALVLQAGALAHGVEIAAAVAWGEGSLIRRQAELAIPTRMAALEALARNLA
jgi:aspartate carbamoyltransferase catalytic subunit